jgi:hypothetical protein
MAGFFQRYLTLRGADNEGAAGGFHNIVRDDRQAIDFHDTFNLHKQAVQKSEVASGDPGALLATGRDCCSAGS